MSFWQNAIVLGLEIKAHVEKKDYKVTPNKGIYSIRSERREVVALSHYVSKC